VNIPHGEFWDWAYSARHCGKGFVACAADVLRAICLGALHGPLSKNAEERSYFSNQMPRTFASKPDYSVRYWKERNLRPESVDVIRVIKRRVARLELDTVPACAGGSRVCAAHRHKSRADSAQLTNIFRLPRCRKKTMSILNAPHMGD